MNWFEELFGFVEQNPDTVRANIDLKNGTLRSRSNGRIFRHGELEIPSLAELRQSTKGLCNANSSSTLTEIVANVQDLHVDPKNAGALFQVASQCNLLEMVGPSVTPEEGISRYIYDRTQGPACALAAAAGTLYRNYFHPVQGSLGQSQHRQINTLIDLKTVFGECHGLWETINGYALGNRQGLELIAQKLQSASLEERREWLGALRIGVQWNTETTILGTQNQLVQQVYCSAMPVSYSSCTTQEWESLARFILEASYEATLLAALKNKQLHGSNRVFLTLLGGGAFGNPTPWIQTAILRALNEVRYAGLDIRIVSYGYSQEAVQEIIQQYQQL